MGIFIGKQPDTLLTTYTQVSPFDLNLFVTEFLSSIWTKFQTLRNLDLATLNWRFGWASWVLTSIPLASRLLFPMGDISRKSRYQEGSDIRYFSHCSTGILFSGCRGLMCPSTRGYSSSQEAFLNFLCSGNFSLPLLHFSFFFR